MTERTYKQRKSDKESNVEWAKGEVMRISYLLARKEQEGASLSVTNKLKRMLNAARLQLEDSKHVLADFLAENDETPE